MDFVQCTSRKQDAALKVVQAPPGVIKNSGTPSGCHWRRLHAHNAHRCGSLSDQF
jgi:hypothetical protein